MEYWESYENPRDNNDNNFVSSDTLPWLEKPKYLPFATREQLLNWYTTQNGEIVINNCLSSKHYKLAWKEYTTRYNAQNEKITWWRLQTTVDGIIKVFGGTKYNVFNFRAVFSWKSLGTESEIPSGMDRFATPERLHTWYETDGGRSIVEACKKSENYIETWQTLVQEWNNKYAVEQGWYVPSTTNGVLWVFGIKNRSLYNLVAVFSGKELTEEEMNSGQKKRYATKEQLLKWYQGNWKETLQSCRESVNFTKAWRAYAIQFNKEDIFEYWFRLPLNKVGLVTTLGGVFYTIPEIVRLFECLPKWSEIPRVQKETKCKVSTLIRQKTKKKVVPRVKKVIVKKVVVEKTEPKSIINTPVIPAGTEIQTKPLFTMDEVKNAAMKALETEQATPVIYTTDTSMEIKESKVSIIKQEDVKINEEELSEWMLDYSIRFPNFLEIHKKFYLPFRRFIQSLEKVCSSETKIDYKDIRIEVITKGILLITIEKAFLYEHSYSLVDAIFHEVQDWYGELYERNRKAPFIEMKLHMEL